MTRCSSNTNNWKFLLGTLLLVLTTIGKKKNQKKSVIPTSSVYLNHSKCGRCVCKPTSFGMFFPLFTLFTLPFLEGWGVGGGMRGAGGRGQAMLWVYF